MKKIENISVIGGGSWGTAIACHLARNGHAVRMWVYEKEVAEGINTHHINPFFLSDISLPESIRATTDMEEALAQAGSIVMVVPSNFYRRIAKSLPPFLSDEIFILNASKGIEDESLRLMTQILEEELPEKFHRRIACLSGPSFAREVAGKKFTAVTIASSSEKTSKIFQRLFNGHFFRTYIHHDPIGVQLGGALKNVIAIAVGIADGKEMGLNARAALITRSLAEITRIGIVMGADATTFLGLAGLGDLVLTCTGDLSRNRTVGLKLGQGITLKAITNDMKMIAEGILNTKSAYALASSLKVRAPIISGMYHILFKGASVEETLETLLAREPGKEMDGLG